MKQLNLRNCWRKIVLSSCGMESLASNFFSFRFLQQLFAREKLELSQTTLHNFSFFSFISFRVSYTHASNHQRSRQYHGEFETFAKFNSAPSARARVDCDQTRVMVDCVSREQAIAQVNRHHPRKHWWSMPEKANKFPHNWWEREQQRAKGWYIIKS